MKKKKNGFTLVELLVTIALMLTILGIAIVSFVSISNRKKEEAWQSVKAQIETAAEEYFSANEYYFEGLVDGTTGTISVGKLVSEDYINKVTNPITGETVSYCSLVSVTKNGNKLSAEYKGEDTSSINTKEMCDKQEHIVYVLEPGAPTLNVEIIGNKHGENNEWYNSQEDSAPTGIRTEASGSTNGYGKILSLKYCKDGKEDCNDVANKITYGNTDDTKREFSYHTDDDNNNANKQGYGSISYTASNSKAKAYYEVSYKLDNVPPTIEDFIVASNNSYYKFYDGNVDFYVEPRNANHVNYANYAERGKLITSKNKLAELTLDSDDEYYLLNESEEGKLSSTIITKLNERCSSKANFCLLRFTDPSKVRQNLSVNSEGWQYDDRNASVCYYKRKKESSRYEERSRYEKDTCLVVEEFYGRVKLNLAKMTKSELFNLLKLNLHYTSYGNSDFYDDMIGTYSESINGLLVNVSFKANDVTSKVDNYDLQDINYIEKANERKSFYDYLNSSNGYSVTEAAEEIFERGDSFVSGKSYEIVYSTKSDSNNDKSYFEEKEYNKENLKNIKTRRYKVTNLNNKAYDGIENNTISLKDVIVPGTLDGSVVYFKLNVKDKAGNVSKKEVPYQKYYACGVNIEQNTYSFLSSVPTCTPSATCGVRGTADYTMNYYSYYYDRITGTICSPTYHWTGPGQSIANSALCSSNPCPAPGAQTCTVSSTVTNNCGDDGRKKVKYTYADCSTKEEYVDCGVKKIELDLNTNDAGASKNKGMGGVGPDSSSGKGPIFKSNVDKVAAYSCKYNRGMDVDVSCDGYRKYAASSCMNVYDFERRFKYKITWEDDSVSDYRYVTLPVNSTSENDTKFTDRKTPLVVSVSEDMSGKVLRYGCSNNGAIVVASCGEDKGWTPNVTKHVYYVSYSNIISNKVALYTKYFADCKY